MRAYDVSNRARQTSEMGHHKECLHAREMRTRVGCHTLFVLQR
jgi:hypothetical protein